MGPIRHTAHINSIGKLISVCLKKILQHLLPSCVLSLKGQLVVEERTHNPLRIPTDKSHMASDRLNVEAMRYKLYRETLFSLFIGWEQ
ncbi:hypothetical protein TNCV_2707831 [Trichonephila clavipes]|nr:hypothetical protein TNCV_2707831 [Trichonephila clavipes]